MYRHRVSGLKTKNKRVARPTPPPGSSGERTGNPGVDPAFAGKEPDQIVREFLPIIRRIAAELVLRNPGAMDVEDLTSAGVMGLLSAITRFDPTREIKFRTFAEYRIRGAMLDELRAMDWVPRSVRSKIDKVQQVSIDFTNKEGRPPDQSEMAELLGLKPDELGEAVTKEVTLLSLDEWVGDEEDSCTLKDVLPAKDQLNPLEACISNQLGDVLKLVMTRLPERQQKIIQLYYFSGMTMRAIGAIQGLTESGVCRIHADALNRLKTELLSIGADMQDSQPAKEP